MQKRFERKLASLDAISRWLGNFFAGHHVYKGAEYSINVAVEELFTNMVKYNMGTSEKILVRIRLEKTRIKLEVIDFDVDRFDPDKAERSSVEGSIEERKVGGLGLRLVESVVDEISYDYKDRQMKVTVTKNLER